LEEKGEKRGRPRGLKSELGRGLGAGRKEVRCFFAGRIGRDGRIRRAKIPPRTEGLQTSEISWRAKGGRIAMKTRKESFDPGKTSRRPFPPPPMISVICTTGRPETLVPALKSIQAQSYPNTETIVVHYGPRQRESILPDLPSPSRFTYVWQSAREGDVAAARNAGLKLARGKYVAFWDPELPYHPDHLNTLVQFLKGSDYRVAHADPRGTTPGKENPALKPDPEPLTFPAEVEGSSLLPRNPPSGFLFEKACFDEMGLFEETAPARDAEDFFSRLHERFPVPRIRVEDRAGMKKEEKYQRAQQLIQEERWDEAIRALEEVLISCPAHSQAHDDLGALYFLKMEERKALEHFARAVEADPRNINALKNLADLSLHLGYEEEALQLCRKIMEEIPEDPEALQMIHRLGHQLAPGAEVKEIALPPSGIEGDREKSRFSPESSSNSYLPISSIGPGDALSPFPEEDLVRRGEGLFRAGNLEEAELVFRKALAHAPRDPEVLNNLGAVAYESGRREEAISFFHRALEVDPAYFDALDNLGHALLEKGDDAGALHWLTEASRQRPGDPGILKSMEDCLCRVGGKVQAGETEPARDQKEGGLPAAWIAAQNLRGLNR